MAAAPLHESMSLPTSRFYEPKRIDWATSQSESQDISDDVAFTESPTFTTPPQKAVGDVPASSSPSGATIGSSSPAISNKVYDIATLLSYRGSLAGIGVFAKIKPEALTGQWSS